MVDHAHVVSVEPGAFGVPKLGGHNRRLRGATAHVLTKAVGTTDYLRGRGAGVLVMGAPSLASRARQRGPELHEHGGPPLARGGDPCTGSGSDIPGDLA